MMTGIVSNFYVDVHAIQTVPPSCVNRDDTGAPKTCMYGGVMRARVSSQSWKKAVRDMFSNYGEKYHGVRTKKDGLVQVLADLIVSAGLSSSRDEAKRWASNALDCSGFFSKSKNTSKGDQQDDDGNEDANNTKNTDTSFSVSYTVLRNMISDVVDCGKEYDATEKNATARKKTKEKWKDRLFQDLKTRPYSVDIAMFGRMFAKDASANVDACVQVAHAISTHEVEQEFDYYTLVNDVDMDVEDGKTKHAGALNLGNIDFNSSTLYRFTSINVAKLQLELDSDLAEAVVRYIHAFLMSMPAARQNSFANKTVPDMVYVTIRTDSPLSLSGAFEHAIVSDNGYVDASKEQLLRYASKLYQMYDIPPVLSYGIGLPEEKSSLVDIQEVTLSVLLDEIEKQVTDWNVQHPMEVQTLTDKTAEEE